MPAVRSWGWRPVSCAVNSVQIVTRNDVNAVERSGLLQITGNLAHRYLVQPAFDELAAEDTNTHSMFITNTSSHRVDDFAHKSKSILQRPAVLIGAPSGLR
jgi:hypothetical protein